MVASDPVDAVIAEPGRAAEVRQRIVSLPDWDVDRNDDDPVWIRPITKFPEITKVAEIDTACELTEELVTIGMSTPVYTAQNAVRLDAVLHYLDRRGELFDPEGWYGNDVPVVVRWIDGWLVVDGNHRAISDRLMHRSFTAIVAELSPHPVSSSHAE